LAAAAWKESIEEMKHADQIIERILFLEGIPNLSAYDKINVGPSVQQQLNNDLGLEEAALAVLRAGIKTCLDADDNASRELLEHILVDEEEHVDSIGSKSSCIKSMNWATELSRAANPQDRLVRLMRSIVFHGE
jgi:bacterioferritin